MIADCKRTRMGRILFRSLKIRTSPIGIMPKMDPEGRLNVPSALRKRIELTPGDEFEVFMTEDGSLSFQCSDLDFSPINPRTYGRPQRNSYPKRGRYCGIITRTTFADAYSGEIGRLVRSKSAAHFGLAVQSDHLSSTDTACFMTITRTQRNLPILLGVRA